MLILSKPGSLRVGLQALFSAIPDVRAIVLAEDLRAGLAAASEQKPAIALLVGDPFADQVRVTVQEVKRVSPQTKCILLAEIASQPSLEVEVADAVLLQGAAPKALVAQFPDSIPAIVQGPYSAFLQFTFLLFVAGYVLIMLPVIIGAILANAGLAWMGYSQWSGAKEAYMAAQPQPAL